MRVEEATDLLKRVQFEKFTIEVGLVATEAYSGSANVQFQIKAVNSYRPDDPPMELSMGGEVPHYVRTSEDFYDWCLGHLIWFAYIDSREWLYVVVWWCRFCV